MAIRFGFSPYRESTERRAGGVYSRYSTLVGVSGKMSTEMIALPVGGGARNRLTVSSTEYSLRIYSRSPATITKSKFPPCATDDKGNSKLTIIAFKPSFFACSIAVIEKSNKSKLALGNLLCSRSAKFPPPDPSSTILPGSSSNIFIIRRTDREHGLRTLLLLFRLQ